MRVLEIYEHKTSLEDRLEYDNPSAQRGTLTLPAELRDRYNIELGDTYRVLDRDGIFVLTPMIPMVPELARQIEVARCEAGLSIDELLTALREQRAWHATENAIGSEDG